MILTIEGYAFGDTPGYLLIDDNAYYGPFITWKDTLIQAVAPTTLTFYTVSLQVVTSLLAESSSSWINSGMCGPSGTKLTMTAMITAGNNSPQVVKRVCIA